jgi:hypothetical protein
MTLKMNRWHWFLALFTPLLALLIFAPVNSVKSSSGECYFTVSTPNVTTSGDFSVTIENKSEDPLDFNIRFSVPKTKDSSSKQQDHPAGEIAYGNTYHFNLTDLNIISDRTYFYVSVKPSESRNCRYEQKDGDLTTKITFTSPNEDPTNGNSDEDDGSTSKPPSQEKAAASTSFFDDLCPEDFKFCDSTLGDIITELVPILYGLAAMIALLFLIWGGIRYMTARGDPKAHEAARNTITSAIIGLLIVLLVGVIYALIAAVFKIEIFTGLVPTAYAADEGVPIGCTLKLGGECIEIVFPSIGVLFTRIIIFALAAAAFIFFMMLIWGGFRYLSAGGEPKNAEAARQTLTNAAVGLLIVVASLVIIEIVTRVVGTPGIF